MPLTQNQQRGPQLVLVNMYEVRIVCKYDDQMVWIMLYIRECETGFVISMATIQQKCGFIRLRNL